MMTMCRSIGLALVVTCVFPVAAVAQNTGPSDAASLAIGQPPVSLALGAGQMRRWYVLANAVAGRSYCALTGLGQDQSYNTADTLVYVYRADSKSVLGVNQDATSEPGANLGSRICWIAPATEPFYVEVRLAGAEPPAPRYASLRVLETTLWCPWFFIDGDYNAFTLLRNTTNATVYLTVTWRSANGDQAGGLSWQIPRNGNLTLNARAYVTGATAGSVEVAHNASPQAIQGSTTTLSGTTGVGFDAVFTQRQPW